MRGRPLYAGWAGLPVNRHPLRERVLTSPPLRSGGENAIALR